MHAATTAFQTARILGRPVPATEAPVAQQIAEQIVARAPKGCTVTASPMSDSRWTSVMVFVSDVNGPTKACSAILRDLRNQIVTAARGRGFQAKFAPKTYLTYLGRGETTSGWVDGVRGAVFIGDVCEICDGASHGSKACPSDPRSDVQS
jgi:hypothetical protein